MAQTPQNAGKLSPLRFANVDAVLFDVGDTLVHFDTTDARAIMNVSCRAGYDRLVAMGHPLPRFKTFLRSLQLRFLLEWLRSKLRRREIRLDRCISRLLVSYGVLLSDEDFLDVLRTTATPAVVALTSLDKNAAEMIRSLAGSGLKLGLVSNTPFPAFAIDGYLDSAGLLDFFPVRIYSSTVQFMKPDPRIFALALDQLEVPADRVLFVGDRIDTDVVGASRVGMKTALMLHDRPEFKHRVRPDYVIRSLAELQAIQSEPATV